MLKKTLYKHTREFLERSLPENFFLFKKSNKKRIKYFSLKAAFIKNNLSKLKLYKKQRESTNKFLFNLYTIKSQFEKRQTRNSDFKNKLKEKKKLAILYGNLSNKDIRIALHKAIKQGGNININLLHILEKRLDIVLYRALFFPTINTAKQWLRNNKIAVNYRHINIPSYMVSSGDIISVPESSIKHISNNMIKYFIHYKLIHNANILVSRSSFALQGPLGSPSQETLPCKGLAKRDLGPKDPRPSEAGASFFWKPKGPSPSVARPRKLFTNFAGENKLKNKTRNEKYVSSQINNVKLTYECLPIINNVNITLNKIFRFAHNKKNLSGLIKNLLYFAYAKTQQRNFLGACKESSKNKLNVYGISSMHMLIQNLNLDKYNKHLNIISILNSFEYKPFKLKTNLKTFTYPKGFSTFFNDKSTAHGRTKLKHIEKLVFNFIFDKITQDKYKLNLYKTFLHIQQNNLSYSKMNNYNYMLYFKADNLKYIYKYVYSYNFIVKKILFYKHNFKLKARNGINTLYFKALWYQINFKNIFLFRKTVNLLKNALIINNISYYGNFLKKKLTKNLLNNYLHDSYIDIFNCKCKIIQTKINHKIINQSFHIIDAITNVNKKNNSFFSFLEKINSQVIRMKHYDFLFFLKLKKIANTSETQIHAENLPKMFNYHKNNFTHFGKINIKPLNLEISYRTFTIIYLFPPQKLLFPCSLDVELLVKYDI